MPRIRTVKPEFFRHERLQELGPLSMLIFEGLWTQCDKVGRFAWKPRTLKLDILPFINFDMEKELHKLAESFFVVKYEVQGEFFGVIPTFLDHQRINGKEAQSPAQYPDPPKGKPKRHRKISEPEEGSDGEAPEKHPGSDGDEPESQEGKGNGIGIGKGNGTGKGMDLADAQSAPQARSAKELRDAFWDAIKAATNFKAETKDERSRLGKVVSNLVEKHASPEDVPIRASRYRKEWPKAALTPEALLKHWDYFGADKTTGINGAAVNRDEMRATMDKVLREEMTHDL